MRGLEEEFEQVAMPHTRSLLRFARRITRESTLAEDLVQETLLRAWRDFASFQTGTNARAWLFRILLNAFYGHNRKAKSSPAAVELPAELQAPDPRVEPVEVLQALERLGDDHRTVLLLAVVEGFTCREIAEILSVPIGTVMSRLSRAREAMRASLSPTRREDERVVR